jgi:hypothetical protein
MAQKSSPRQMNWLPNRRKWQNPGYFGRNIGQGDKSDRKVVILSLTQRFTINREINRYIGRFFVYWPKCMHLRKKLKCSK